MPRNKDPAVLFYTSDFLADTTLWTYEELGRYIKLLCIQHNQDGVGEDDFLAVSDGYKRVIDKFTKGTDGKYRNKRMQAEQEKRHAYSESRSKNGAQGGRPKKQMETICEPHENHMLSICEPYEKHSENENINKNIDKSISKDTKAIKHKYGLYSNVLLSDEDVTKLQAEFPIDWTDRIERLSEYIASSGKTYKSHLATIRSWAKTDADKPRHDEPKKRYGDFDPVKAFEDALRRSEALDD